MTAIRDGDVGQLGLLFERHHIRLCDFLARMTGDRSLAEDLVQDTFVRILKYRGTYRPGSSFETWLYRIARNVRTDFFRSRLRSRPATDTTLETPEPGPSPLKQLERGAELSCLKEALLRLPDDKRELLVLARYQGMKHERIAELFGIERATVKVKIHRTLQELRDLFVQVSEGKPHAM